MSEARMYKPSVASSEMTMLRKIEFVNKELGVRGPSVWMMLSMPLNARKKAAICTFHPYVARVSITVAHRRLGGHTVM